MENVGSGNAQTPSKESNNYPEDCERKWTHEKPATERGENTKKNAKGRGKKITKLAEVGKRNLIYNY